MADDKRIRAIAHEVVHEEMEKRVGLTAEIAKHAAQEIIATQWPAILRLDEIRKAIRAYFKHPTHNEFENVVDALQGMLELGRDDES